MTQTSIHGAISCRTRATQKSLILAGNEGSQPILAAPQHLRLTVNLSTEYSESPMARVQVSEKLQVQHPLIAYPLFKVCNLIKVRPLRKPPFKSAQHASVFQHYSEINVVTSCKFGQLVLP